VRQNFGILFQNAALFDEMSIFENVAFPLREFTNLAEPDIQEQVALSLTKLGLPKSWDRSPTTLSGGQKKRVALARAIIRKPTVLLYDEPTTGLDPVNRIAVDELIDALKKDFQLTSIVISHDISSALFLGDFIAFLFEGHIIFFGPPAEFKKNDHPAIQGFLNAERRFTQYL
jgi:phospholipid/cholesterol/gamma-HCH transport system ATP-binding protein